MIKNLENSNKICNKQRLLHTLILETIIININIVDICRTSHMLINLLFYPESLHSKWSKK